MKIAFIGGHGHHYLKNLLQNPELELEIAVAGDGYDNSAARNTLAKVTMANRAAPLWFDSPAALVESFSPEIVSIGAVYGYNGDIAALALERDIAVVSDKPVAATWAQWERLRALTSGNPRVLLTEFPFRCQNEFRAARAAVQSGQIGEVVLATAQKSYRFGASRPNWYRNREAYPGTLFWVASHGVDAIHFCGGVPFWGTISASGNLSRRDYGANFEDHVVALFGLQNGGSALVHADFLRPEGAPSHGDDRLRIAGTLGVVEVRDGRCQLITAQGENDISENDITESVSVRPIEQEFLAAIRGEIGAVYSTAESLAVAEILLHARDAQNAPGWMDIS